jgi:CRP/FNR family nitrogen fixation transcriptional regulator
MKGMYRMLARVNANSSKSRSSSELDTLSDKKAFLNEFSYRQDTEIFGEGEPAEYVFQIVEGAVRSYKLLSDGRRQISAFHLPGDIFGVETTDAYRFTAEAVIATKVRIARRRTLFGSHSDGDAPAIKNVLNLVARNLQHAENHMLLLGRKTALEKVVAFLREMDRRSAGAGVMILPMSRRDIADYLGLTFETVSRALSILRNRGILSFIGQTQRQIVLENRFKLAELDL